MGYSPRGHKESDMPERLNNKGKQTAGTPGRAAEADTWESCQRTLTLRQVRTPEASVAKSASKTPARTQPFPLSADRITVTI